MIIKNITFYVKINDRGWHYHGFWFEPSYWAKIVSGWAMEYTDVARVSNLVKNIERLNKLPVQDKEKITSNENHIYIEEKNLITFDMKYVTGLDPVTLPIEDTLYIFEKYREWLLQYENSQVPGVIPLNKLETWVCVPREAVRNDWWDKKGDN